MTILTADELLHAYHDAHPGATTRAFARWRLDETARSSYDVLADFVAGASAGEVALDVACGDGFLMERLLAHPTPPAAVIGVDASAAELKVARRRRSLKRGTALHLGRAQDLPIPTGEVQAAACHMALMLMLPIEPVIDSIARILTEDGAFGAIVSAGSRDPVYARFVTHLRAVRSVPMPPLGDDRVFSDAGLRALLAAHFPRVEVSRHTLSRTAPPADLWPDLAGMYDVFLLDEDARAALRTAFLADFADPAEPVTAGFQVHFVRACGGWAPSALRQARQPPRVLGGLGEGRAPGIRRDVGALPGARHASPGAIPPPPVPAGHPGGDLGDKGTHHIAGVGNAVVEVLEVRRRDVLADPVRAVEVDQRRQRRARPGHGRPAVEIDMLLEMVEIVGHFRDEGVQPGEAGEAEEGVRAASMERRAVGRIDERRVAGQGEAEVVDPDHQRGAVAFPPRDATQLLLDRIVGGHDISPGIAHARKDTRCGASDAALSGERLSCA
jgi:SAM-dependent methyltransferase